MVAVCDNAMRLRAMLILLTSPLTMETTTINPHPNTASSCTPAYAPELFHLLPDLQFAGSLLGDGGFAEHSKLPKRHLEDYDDIRPFTLDTLSPDGTGGGDATIRAVAGRQMLLRASYYSEEVVLKGFVMGEKEQRVGLERELAILARLRNESVICPRALIEDFDLFESTAYMQKVAVFIEYPFYKGEECVLT